MSFGSRRKSLSFAINGLKELIVQEPNAKIHLAATAAAIIAGIAQQIEPMQWAAITFAIALVWIAEAINTCIEKLCDFSSGHKWYPEIKIIKDIAAAGVLIAAIVSIVIAALVFVF